MPSILEVDSLALNHDVGLWADHAPGAGFTPLTLVLIAKRGAGAQPVDLLRTVTLVGRAG